jgi:hypothetical protein
MSGDIYLATSGDLNLAVDISEDVVVWFCDCRLSTDVPQL